MNWLTIVQALIKYGPTIEQVVHDSVDAFKKTTAPQAPSPGAETITKKPSEAIKALQKVMNTALQIQPPLAEDGWLGPKTEAAIFAALEKLAPALGGK